MFIKFYVSTDPEDEYGREVFAYTAHDAVRYHVEQLILSGDAPEVDTVFYARSQHSQEKETFRVYEIRCVPEVTLRTVPKP